MSAPTKAIASDGGEMAMMVRAGLALVCSLVVLLAAAPGASAEFGFDSFDVSFAPAQPGGEVAAGMPVDLVADFELNSHVDPETGDILPDGLLTDLTVGLPAGLLGNPLAVPRCRQSDLIGSYVFSQSGPDDGCPAATQVGVADTMLSTTAHRDAPCDVVAAPVFNMQTRHEDEPARLGFVIPLVGVVVNLGAQVRSDSDYGVDSSVAGIVVQGPTIVSTSTRIWGVPSDAANDEERWSTPRIGGNQCEPDPPTVAANPGLPLRPFLTAPTQCETPLVATIEARSAEEPDREVAAAAVIGGDFDSDPATAPDDLSPTDTLSGCERVPFDPSLSARPSSTRVDSPTGLDVELSVPQHTSTSIPQSSHVRSSTVTLPEGLSVNPAAAHGLVACSDERLRLGTRLAADCPEGSKIAAVEVDTPVLERPLKGYMVQRPQLPDETFRVAVVASGAGVHLKIPGVVRPDHRTGQIVSVFDQTPQAPFSNLSVRFDRGPTAPLATPANCGAHTTTGTFTPWSGTPAVNLASSFGTSWDGAGAPCPAVLPFDVDFHAGSVSALAGKTSPLVVRLQRADRHQQLRSVSVDMPQGMAAYLRGVQLCDQVQAAAGDCPAASRIGSVLAGAGAGPAPYYVTGDAYLTDGYKGGAFGIATVVPVRAGPFDLGEIVVRSALHVDRRTAEITVISDPLPRIVEGVPLRARDIRIAIDRENFAVNPTSCAPKQIRATSRSYGGATDTDSAGYRALECAALAFKPRLRMRLVGRRQTRTGGHPAIRARLRQGPGQAAIENARVVFPRSLALDPDNAQGLCEFADGTKDEPTCPDSSIVGRVRATSPLLNEPLTGPVYFVKNIRTDPNTGNQIRTLPMVVAALRGEIAINLRGTSNSTRSGRLVSTFANVPDAPVSQFDIAIKGGRAGILTVTRTRKGNIDLCRKPRSHIANTPFTAHNGRTHNTRTRLTTPCPKAGNKRKAKRRRAAKRRKAAAVRQRAAARRR